MLVDKSMKLMMFATGPLYRPDVVALQGQGDATTARRLKYGQYALVPLLLPLLLHLAQVDFRRPSSHGKALVEQDDMFRVSFL